MSKNESPAVGTELSWKFNQLRQGRFSLAAVASVKASARALNSGFLPGPRWVKSPNERLNSWLPTRFVYKVCNTSEVFVRSYIICMQYFLSLLCKVAIYTPEDELAWSLYSHRYMYPSSCILLRRQQILIGVVMLCSSRASVTAKILYESLRCVLPNELSETFSWTIFKNLTKNM